MPIERGLPPVPGPERARRARFRRRAWPLRSQPPKTLVRRSASPTFSSALDGRRAPPGGCTHGWPPESLSLADQQGQQGPRWRQRAHRPAPAWAGRRLATRRARTATYPSRSARFDTFGARAAAAGWGGGGAAFAELLLGAAKRPPRRGRSPPPLSARLLPCHFAAQTVRRHQAARALDGRGARQVRRGREIVGPSVAQD